MGLRKGLPSEALEKADLSSVASLKEEANPTQTMASVSHALDVYHRKVGLAKKK